MVPQEPAGSCLVLRLRHVQNSCYYLRARIKPLGRGGGDTWSMNGAFHVLNWILCGLSLRLCWETRACKLRIVRS